MNPDLFRSPTPLERFVDGGDREYPPHFVGRDKQLKAASAVIRATHAATEGQPVPQGQTLVIHDAPGAGKTAFLNHIRHVTRATPSGWFSRLLANAPAPPLVLEIEAPHFQSECLLIEAILAHSKSSYEAFARHAERRGKTREFHASTTISAIPEFHSVLADSLGPPGAPASLVNLAGDLPAARWTQSVVLLHDEVQSLPRDAVPGLLRLHKNAALLPICVILAGLPDSVPHLQRNGFSRFAAGNILALGALAPSETADAVKVFHKTFSLGSPPSWTDEAHDLTQGWPAHLHAYLAAYGREMLLRRPTGAPPDPDAVRDDYQSRQIAYYESRTAYGLSSAPEFYAEVMRAIPPHGASESAILADIRNVSRRFPDPDQLRPATPREVLALMQRRGALAPTSIPNALNCPIPSFRTYLIQQGDRQRHQAAHAPPSSEDDAKLRR